MYIDTYLIRYFEVDLGVHGVREAMGRCLNFHCLQPCMYNELSNATAGPPPLVL